ncbi:MAG: alpha/beta hydrolase [Planctomycetota bacterium]
MKDELAHQIWRGKSEGSAKTVEHRAWFLHGIMGSQRNWRSFAKAMAEAHPQWECVTIDLRNHGASGPRTGANTLEACAKDLAALAERIGPPRFISGHSFGGKVALEYATRIPMGLCDLLVLDCPPGLNRVEVSDSGEGELAKVLAALDQIPIPIERRSRSIELLLELGLPRSLASWMSTNLVRNPDPEGKGYVWAFGLSEIREMIEDYWACDYLPFLRDYVESGSTPFQITFVQAEMSDRWSQVEVEELRALAGLPESPIAWKQLLRAGHWLHVDEPEQLASLLEPHFS